METAIALAARYLETLDMMEPFIDWVLENCDNPIILKMAKYYQDGSLDKIDIGEFDEFFALSPHFATQGKDINSFSMSDCLSKLKINEYVAIQVDGKLIWNRITTGEYRRRNKEKTYKRKRKLDIDSLVLARELVETGNLFELRDAGLANLLHAVIGLHYFLGGGGGDRRNKIPENSPVGS